jgi:DNA-binding response OmpR family regulator
MQGKQIIVHIDDDPEDLEMVAYAMDKYDHIELIQASDGYAGMEVLNQLVTKGNKPCLVLLDVKMPGMNGRDVLMKVKQNELMKEIPVTLFTTSNSDSDKTLASKYKADFISKPHSFSNLQEVVGQVILNRCT